jgi:hypothetical protein
VSAPQLILIILRGLFLLRSCFEVQKFEFDVLEMVLMVGTCRAVCVGMLRRPIVLLLLLLVLMLSRLIAAAVYSHGCSFYSYSLVSLERRP